MGDIRKLVLEVLGRKCGAWEPLAREGASLLPSIVLPSCLNALYGASRLWEPTRTSLQRRDSTIKSPKPTVKSIEPVSLKLNNLHNLGEKYYKIVQEVNFSTSIMGWIWVNSRGFTLSSVPHISTWLFKEPSIFKLSISKQSSWFCSPQPFPLLNGATIYLIA